MELNHLGSPVTKNLRLNLWWERWCWPFFWTQKDIYWKTTWKRGVYDQPCKIQCFDGQQSEASNLHWSLLSKKFCCCMTMHASHAEIISWVLRCWDTLPPAQNLHLPTIISLDSSKMLYKVIDFLQIKECKKWCINGCTNNRKPPSWREYTSLWTTRPSVSKRKKIR